MSRSVCQGSSSRTRIRSTFIQTATQLIMLSELDATWRTIWIYGRSHPPNPDPKFNGDAVGHWEGDTLVVDVIAIDTHTWLTGPGGNIIWFPSDVMHVTERMWRPGIYTCMYEVTVDDPKVLTKPWTSAPNRYSIGRFRWATTTAPTTRTSKS